MTTQLSRGMLASGIPENSGTFADADGSLDDAMTRPILGLTAGVGTRTRTGKTVYFDSGLYTSRFPGRYREDGAYMRVGVQVEGIEC